MNLFRYSSQLRSQIGFTLLEALVATTLTSVIMGLVYGSVMTVRDGYIHDVYRTRVNSNLRSSMDILSMNIRQAGEYLQSSFPAVEVVDNGISDQLKLRRSLIPETLALCTTLNAVGATTLELSSGDLSDSACYVNNVESAYDIFAAILAADDDSSVRVYIYDRVSALGEFLDLTAMGRNGDVFRLTVSPTTNLYDRLNTSVYLIEELFFRHVADEETLVVDFDGITDDTRAVAFNISGFELSLTMEDASVIQSFNLASSYNWKQIEQIRVNISGQDTFKDRVVASSVSAEFFPRNILSFD